MEVVDGGGIKIIPQAIIQPSTFLILLIHSISKWKILGLFLTVFTGKHTTFKENELFETTKLKIMSKGNTPYQVDGETAVCDSCTITKQSKALYIMRTGK